MGQIHTGNLPLGISLRHHVPFIIICRRPPEVWHWNRFQQFFSPIAVGHHPSAQIRKQGAKVLSLHSGIPFPMNHTDFPSMSFFRTFHTVNHLPKRYFMTCLCPKRTFLQRKGNGHGIFSRRCPPLHRQRICLFRKRRHICFQHCFFYLPPFPLYKHHTAVF